MSDSGEPVAEGGFTVSPDKAAWKLAKYRLASRSDYTIHLLAAAVAGGASEFKLQSSPSSTFLSFDGACFQRAELSTLGRIADSDLAPSKSLRELEIALSAASGFSVVRFSTGEPGRRSQLTMLEGELTLSSPSSSMESLNTFLVEAPLTRESIESFVQRAFLAPLKVEVDGTLLDQNLEFGQAKGLVRAFWIVEGRDPFRLPRLESDETCLVCRKKSPQEPSLVLCLVEPKWSGYAKALLLADGVLQSKQANFFGFEMITGAVSTAHLQRDLSGQGLLENEAYHRFKLWVKGEVDEFLSAFCRSPVQSRSVFSRVFRLNLEKYYQGAVPPREVLKYLEETRGLEPSRDSRELDRLVESAQSTGSEIYLNRMDSALLFEIEKATRRQAWSEAKDWNASRRYLRQRLGRESEAQEAVEKWLDFLDSFQENRRWALTVGRDQDRRPGDRFRALLTMYPSSGESEWDKLLAGLDLPSAWTMPLTLYSPQAKRSDGFWKLAENWLRGQTESFLHTVGSMEALEPLLRATLLELFARTQGGQLPWKEQIKLTALRSTSWVKVPMQLKKEFYAQLELKEQSKPPPVKDSRFHHLPESSQLFLPILLYQLWLMRSGDPTWPKRYLARTLLLESLRSSSGESELGEALPPEPFLS